MRYKHDCPLCKYLGEFNGHDLYYCIERHGIYTLSYGELTIIIRISNSEFSAVSLRDIADNENTDIITPSEEEALRRYRLERTKDANQ